MFTGIIRAVGKVSKIKTSKKMTQFTIFFENDFLSNVEIGASIAIDGVCLTVVHFTSNEVSFDAIEETLLRTNLSLLKEGEFVNAERAVRFGDEIGGHILSGHIYYTAEIQSIERKENHCAIFLKSPLYWMKYLFSKGYIALNGASLTLVDVDKLTGIFSVHLIPETLAKTTFGIKKINDVINVEIDTQTQAIVDTVEAMLGEKNSNLA